MTDDFLRRFEERRAEREQADRNFPLAGETLTHKPAVAPEVGSRLEAAQRQASADLAEYQRRMDSGETMDGLELDLDDRVILAIDEAVLACLEPECHDAWARLRSVAGPHPLNMDELLGFVVFIIGRVSGVPTVAPAGSSDGRTTIDPQSKEDSPSTAKTSTASA